MNLHCNNSCSHVLS